MPRPTSCGVRDGDPERTPAPPAMATTRPCSSAPRAIGSRSSQTERRADGTGPASSRPWCPGPWPRGCGGRGVRTASRCAHPPPTGPPSGWAAMAADGGTHGEEPAPRRGGRLVIAAGSRRGCAAARLWASTPDSLRARHAGAPSPAPRDGLATPEDIEHRAVLVLPRSPSPRAPCTSLRRLRRQPGDAVRAVTRRACVAAPSVEVARLTAGVRSGARAPASRQARSARLATHRPHHQWQPAIAPKPLGSPWSARTILVGFGSTVAKR